MGVNVMMHVTLHVPIVLSSARVSIVLVKRAVLTTIEGKKSINPIHLEPGPICPLKQRYLMLRLALPFSWP
jgi:hypothetical protein